MDQSTVALAKAAWPAVALGEGGKRPVYPRSTPGSLFWKFRHVGDVFAERIRQVQLVFLLLPQNLADVFGDAVLPERFALPHTLAIIPHRLVLVVEIEAQHVCRLVR